MEDGIWKMGKKNILEYFDTKNKKLHDNTIEVFSLEDFK